MFESVTFRNLQKHKNKTIDFDPKVTVLVGPSQAGKSGIIRGLGLLCLNHWNKAFLRHGKKFVSASLKVDGKTIKRKKGQGVNLYFVNGKALKRDLGSGNAVPTEVADILNVGQENFQKQLDQHFWFSDTPGQVSRNLNKIVNLNAIDSTLSAAASEVKSSKVELEVSQSRLRSAKEQLEELKWVEEFAADLEVLERHKEKLRLKSHRIASIRYLIANVQNLASKQESVSNALLDAKKVLSVARKGRELSKRRESLQKLIGQLRQVAIIEKDGCPDITELVSIRSKADKKAEERRELETLIEELQLAEKEECARRHELKSSQEELSRLNKSKRCPLCRSKTTKVLSKQSSSVMYTCERPHRSLVPKKVKAGTTSWPAVAKNSKESKTKQKPK